MKPAYLFVDIKVHDLEKMQPYLDKAAGTLASFGGQPIVKGGEVLRLEGKEPRGSGVLIIRFPSMEQARAWYDSPEYQALIPFRTQASEAEFWLLEGV